MMRKKKLLKVALSGLSVGFIVGLAYSFPSLKNSYFYIQHNKYLQYKLLRLTALSLHQSLFIWLKMALLSAVILILLWFVWHVIFYQNAGLYLKSRIDWITFTMKRNKIFKKIKPFEIAATSVVMTLVILNLGMFIDNKIYKSSNPNVILIVCETLRADHMGYQGYKGGITNHVDSLAQQAFVFNNAYVQTPCTRPSMWNIVTSKYQSAIPAENRYVTMAEFFKAHHYQTAAFISQQFLTPEKSNLHQGFDVYDAKCDKDEHGLSLRKASSVTDAAGEWIEENKKRPFFIWLVYFDPHDPYIPPQEFRGIYNRTENFNRDRRVDGIHMKSSPIPIEHRQFLINAYDEEIKYFDYQVGRLLENLKRSGEYDNSIIILTSDHGEELDDNDHRWDHCQLLSQEEIWVPLLIKMPHQKKQKIISDAVQSIDVYPSLIEYFHPRHLPSYSNTLDGKSLMPLIEKRNPNKNQFAVSFWQGQKCIIKGNYKYWLRGKKEIFMDIKTKQKVNDTELLSSLREELDRTHEKYILKKKYYKETEDRLKSLGYIK